MADVMVVGPQPRSEGYDLYKSSGWWGILLGIATEAAIFAYLLFSYYYMAIELHGAWHSAGPPSLRLALPNTIVLLVSSVTFWWAERQFIAGRRTKAIAALSATAGLGAVFLIVQLFEWHNKAFSISSDPYGSLYFTITGFHMAHVIVGLAMMIAIIVWMCLGLLDHRRHVSISIGAIYWHFVDAVWLTVFFTFYLTPYLS